MNDEDMDTYVFAVGTRKALVRLQKEMQDLVCRVIPTQIHVQTVPICYIDGSPSEHSIINPFEIGQCIFS